MADKQLMDSTALNTALDDISRQIISSHPETGNLALMGIRSKGKELAKRIAAKIKERTGIKLGVGVIDTSLYRDDVHITSLRPILCKTEIPFPLNNKKIILVDDVLFTGRTIRAAFDAIMDIGRPGCIQLAVLIDRGHRELPIHANYVGLVVRTTRQESVRVKLNEDRTLDEVVLKQEPEPKTW